MADTSLLRAVAAFEVALPGGGSIAVHVGDLFPADDPIIVGREAHFAPLHVRSSRHVVAPARAAETTSAAPGTRRLLTRADKPSAPKAPERPADKPKPGGGKSDA